MSDFEKIVTGILGRQIETDVPKNYQMLTYDASTGKYFHWSGAALYGDRPETGNILYFPNSPVAGTQIFLIHTEGEAQITSGGSGTLTISPGNNVAPISTVSSTIGTLFLSTDAHQGSITTWCGTTAASNGPLYISSGTAADSLSASANNIYLDAGSQNATPHGNIVIKTGYGSNQNPTTAITLDTTNASEDPAAAQVSLTCAQTRFNSTGLCFSQISFVTADYAVNNGRTSQYDYILSVDSSAAPVTITLPTSPNKGDTYIIKDGAGAAATNNITLDGGTLNIDGATTHVISTNFDKVTVIFDSVKWITI